MCSFLDVLMSDVCMPDNNLVCGSNIPGPLNRHVMLEVCFYLHQVTAIPGLNTFKPQFKPHTVPISLLVNFFSLDVLTHPPHPHRPAGHAPQPPRPTRQLQTMMCSADSAVFMPVYLQGGTIGTAGHGASSRVGAARSCHFKLADHNLC